MLRNPVLTLLTLSKDRITKKHENDWVAMTPHNLTLTEARAIYAVLPTFRRDQQRQIQFVEALKTKIEDLKKKATQPLERPIAPKKDMIKFVRPAVVEGGPSSFLEELMQRNHKH